MPPINTVSNQIYYLLPDPEEEIYKNVELLLVEKKEINIYDISYYLKINLFAAKRIMKRISKEKGIS